MCVETKHQNDPRSASQYNPSCSVYVHVPVHIHHRARDTLVCARE